MRFKDTALKQAPRRLELHHNSQGLLLELQGQELDDAMDTGFIDPERLHGSMFDYARMLRETGSFEIVDAPAEAIPAAPFVDDERIGNDPRWN